MMRSVQKCLVGLLCRQDLSFTVELYVCQLWGDVCQQRAKYAIFINNLYQRYITRVNVCQFHRAIQSRQTYLSWMTFLHIVFEIFLHMSYDLPGPLRTAFVLKADLPASSFTPDAATLTLHVLNRLNMPKHQNTFSKGSNKTKI